jgi:DNA segregation ATPase FtsK/SpoIIIE-like protein
MKPLNSLENIIVSRSRVKLLQELFYLPGEMYYIRQLTRMTEEKINSIRRELKNLDEADIVNSEWRANKRFYWANQDNDLFEEILKIVLKTKGLGRQLIDKRHQVGKIKFAFLSSQLGLNLEPKDERIDLFVVGKVVLPELGVLVRGEEKRRDREINYSVMEKEEFKFRKDKKDPFITDILMQGRVMLIGQEHKMLEY